MASKDENIDVVDDDIEDLSTSINQNRTNYSCRKSPRAILQSIDQITQHDRINSEADSDEDFIIFREINTGPAVAPTDPTVTSVRSITTRLGETCTIGQTWECFDGSFFRIEAFAELDVGSIAYGKRFRYCHEFSGRLPQEKDQVCQEAVIDENGNDLLATAEPDSFMLLRELIVTNVLPDTVDNFSCDGEAINPLQNYSESTILVCRWKFCKQLSTGLETLRRFSSTESDAGKSIPDWMLSEYHHQYWETTKPASPKFDVAGEKEAVSKSTPYTYGEIATGAGCATRGAIDSGVVVSFLVDIWDIACQTLKLNWPQYERQIYCMEVFEFITQRIDKHPGLYVVDILHLSPPCQFFSPCHTTPGRNDEVNIAVSFCIRELLHGCRPRIVTLEQTFNIVCKDRGQWLDAIIAQFTDCDYSVQWRVENFAETGNVHARRRLILTAAAPGEELPPFPRKTHGIGPGLLPFMTIERMLSIAQRPNIPKNLKLSTPRDEPPFNPNRQLRGCITTNGGQDNLHPSGCRTYTTGELAVMVGFKPCHRFAGDTKIDILTQIGNALSTHYMKLLMDNVNTSLRRTRVKREAERRGDYVVID